MLKAIPCSIYRGGTSKGAFFLEEDLPKEHEKRVQLFESVMGGGDPKQIDGLGGAQVVTSKVAVIAPSSREFCDVDYTFVQVYPEKSGIDLSSNCGNISSAVGMFAIEKKLVRVDSDKTTIRIYNTNTKKIISSTLDTPGGELIFEGDYSIPGVPGTGPRVQLTFEDPSGAVTGKLLPTGKSVETVSLPSGERVRISIVDCSGLFVFTPMDELGLSGLESADEFSTIPGFLEKVEYIRGCAAVLLGLVERPEQAAKLSAAIPKIVLVGRPPDSVGGAGGSAQNKADLKVCMMTMGKPHKSFAVTGAMCTMAASAIKNSVVNELVGDRGTDYFLKLLNPSGIMEAGVQIGDNGRVENTTAFRTARLLMSGTAYYME